MKKNILITLCTVITVISSISQAQAEPMIGEIRMFAGNFAPRGWAKCEGQLLAISQNTALFSLLGTTYGGDGRTTFALPDLRGRAPVHPGQGIGSTRNYRLGEKGGRDETVVKRGTDGQVQGRPYLGLNYIIALQGIYPSRSSGTGSSVSRPSSGSDKTAKIAEIRMFAGNFAPRGWAKCDGQLLAISQYQALFSILGTTYGGDGRTTFALPDLRGRVPVHAGMGPGLRSVRLGQKGGSENMPVKSGTDGRVEGRPYQVVNYIICLSGIFPSRN